MRIKVLGWRNEEISIVNKLETGFEDLGHELCFSDKEVDILIAINPDMFDEAINSQIAQNGIKIFNVLDVPEHLISMFGYPVEQIKEKLKQADFVTSISEFTRGQVKKHYGVESKVVYTPCLEIQKKEKTRDINFLYVGRAGDPNKRFALIMNAMREAGLNHSDLVVCGPERTRVGLYAGLVTQGQLNDAYNRSKVVLLPSKIEGVGLSMIEGALAGAVPIMCNDNETAKEFGFSDFCCDPTPEEFAKKMTFALANFSTESDKVQSITKKFGLEEKFDRRAVAQKYIDLYENRVNRISL